VWGCREVPEHSGCDDNTVKVGPLLYFHTEPFSFILFGYVGMGVCQHGGRLCSRCLAALRL
jgi:hypothetical protein